MRDEIIKVPDIGSGSAEVIEICVSPGDSIEAEDSLIVLESDKATMEVPAPKAGKVVDIILKVGDSVSEGDDLLKLAADDATAEQPATAPEKLEPTIEVEAAPVAETPAPAASSDPRLETIVVPDIGAENVPVIEVCVKVGDEIAEEDSLIVLESDKATMEVPSPMAGVVKAIKVKEGDEMSQGDLILELEVAGGEAPAKTEAPLATMVAEPAKPEPSTPVKSPAPAPSVDSVSLEKANRKFHAGPAVRKLAREFGVDLSLVKGTGPRSRIVKEDVQSYVKARLSEPQVAPGAVGAGIPEIPAVDFSQWGKIEEKPLTRLRTVASQNFQRSWLNVPHVTQFDEADISELEAFRKAQKTMAEARGTKLTPLPFILKACAYVLKELPQFCASLSPDGKSLIHKHYINIGVAVDTPDGLLVPVIKDVDKKGLWELAEECIELAGKARNKKLKPAEMQGGCFTISSLGAIGGTAFTPIVNAPEVAILGLSKAGMKPVWNGKDFDARLMLPLSLSYDHRAINGAEAARFTAMLGTVLGDIRKMLL
ncbi:dihydrolipoyllysine-residue acetyltransferase [Endozoicomonas sp. Mp262]|uniref:dihydrolipoyllysine-residue acetyltransferase n=1 Tax=Endozoicomonas sp. Mp262 TaxID=2919499 RepID=UPI0021D85680